MPTNTPDTSWEGPWRSFERRLAMTLTRMEIGQFFVVGVNHPAVRTADGVRPYAQVARSQQGWQAELSGNRYLAEQYAVSEAEADSLTQLGWDLSAAGGNWEFLAMTAGEASLRITEALQNVFDIGHPTLLTVENLGSFADHIPQPDVSALVGTPDPTERTVTAEPMPQTIEALVLSTREQLVQAVQASLAGMFNHDIFPDGDGVFALTVDDVLVLIEPSATELPLIHITALVADRVTPSSDLMQYLNQATADLSPAHLFISNQSVYARMDVLASPFVFAAFQFGLDAAITSAHRHHDAINGWQSTSNPGGGLGGYL